MEAFRSLIHGSQDIDGATHDRSDFLQTVKDGVWGAEFVMVRAANLDWEHTSDAVDCVDRALECPTPPHVPRDVGLLESLLNHARHLSRYAIKTLERVKELSRSQLGPHDATPTWPSLGG